MNEIKLDYNPDFIKPSDEMKSVVKATPERIRNACFKIADMLIAKNRSYGDSALKPTGIFAKGIATDLLKVRIDDKLNRIKNAPEAFGEDVIGDLIGYLILLQLALEDEKEGKSC